MELKIMNGNQAAALATKLSRVQVVAAYPITPQTSLGESIAEMWAKNEYPGEFMSVESEYSAISCVVGAAHAGARTFTPTSSQGLAYMHEQLHWAAGARLPLVLVNVNRAIAAPWSVETDQIDSLSQRDTGWIQFYCASVQEILYTLIVAFRLAEEARIPCMVAYDGFVLSHTYEAVQIPTQSQVDSFLPLPPCKPNMSPLKPDTIQAITDLKGTALSYRARHLTMAKIPEVLKVMGEKYKKVFGEPFSTVETVNMEDAETVIVTSGAISETVKNVLPHLNMESDKKGLLRIKLFRPLPREEIISLLENSKAKKLLVIDRNISPGAGGIFTQELRALLNGSSFKGQIFEFNLAGGVDLTLDLLKKGLEKIERSSGSGNEIIWGVDWS